MKARKKTSRQTARQALPGLAKRGFTQADAARELKVSRQRVSQLVAELRLKFRPATPEVPEKRLKELAAKRMTQAEIARELGVSSSRVGRIARKLGVGLAPVWSRPKAPTTKLGKTLQTARLDSGYSYRRLGRIAGLHPRHVAAIEVGRVQKPTQATLRKLSKHLRGKTTFDILAAAASERKRSAKPRGRPRGRPAASSGRNAGRRRR